MRKKILFLFAMLFMIVMMIASVGCSETPSKLPVKVLLLPKFELGDMEGDFPGEAQHLYEAYLKGCEEFTIPNTIGETTTLYYKDNVALCLCGEGKVISALNTLAILRDERFDFSDAYVISTGCAGCSIGYGVMGDVYVVSAAVDYDLGHHADPREMADPSRETWFHDEEFDLGAAVKLDATVVSAVYELVKDVPLQTTEKTKAFMTNTFPGEEWATRDPKVLRGTSVSSDDYWKGIYAHNNALLVAETFGCEDPYAATEMEDVAIGLALQSVGKLDKYIAIRAGVNIDTFPSGVTPESLWSDSDDFIGTEESVESGDIFATAMQNTFDVVSVIVDAIKQNDFHPAAD